MMLKLIYSQAKRSCCQPKYKLSAAGPFDSILDDIAKQLWENKMQSGTIHPELYKQTAGTLMKAVWEGMDGKTFSYNDGRNQLGAYLQQNIHAFSAAKSMYQMRHFANMMVREDDTLRSFTAFRNKVMEAGHEFNVTYLETEYNTAQASAEMARKWQGFKDAGVQYLEYSTAGDNRVRPEHATLDGFTAPMNDKRWSTIYPPNGWNCRCNVVPGNANNIDNVTVPLNSDWSKDYKITPYFQRNCGDEKAVFNLDGPVYKIGNKSKAKQLLAIDHYNMNSVSNILSNNKWSTPKSLESATKAKKWFNDITRDDNYKDVIDSFGTTIRVDAELIRHAVDDNHDNRWEFISEIFNILESPDEVWSTRFEKRLERVYLKYYDGTPLIVRVNNQCRPYTIHNMLDEKGKLKEPQAIQLRKGTLLYKNNH